MATVTELPELLDETKAGNYFVSNYPPYSLWTEEHAAQAHAVLNRPPARLSPLGIYIHIPFCRYCETVRREARPELRGPYRRCN